MSKYIGMFIDDDKKNYDSIHRLFCLKEIELLPYKTLPEEISDIYDNILEENVDFVIIDYDLGKQPVSYTGIDVLKKIREQDKELYIIYLTNKDFVQDHIGEFDQTVKKKDLAKDIDDVVNRLVRALSRDLSIKYERQIKDSYELQKRYLEQRISLLEDALRK